MPRGLLPLPAFVAFIAACTTPASPPATPAAAREPVRSFSEIGFLRGRWTARMGSATAFLLFEPDGLGGLTICEGATAISYARPVRHFLWREDRIAVQDTSSTGPHMPGSWPLLKLGPEHVLIDGSPEEEWRLVGDTLEVGVTFRVPGERAQAGTQVYRRVRSDDAQVDLPNCRM